MLNQRKKRGIRKSSNLIENKGTRFCAYSHERCSSGGHGRQRFGEKSWRRGEGRAVEETEAGAWHWLPAAGHSGGILGAKEE